MLVVAPVSTLDNWEREAVRWAPNLYTVVFHGEEQDREVIQRYGGAHCVHRSLRCRALIQSATARCHMRRRSQARVAAVVVAAQPVQHLGGAGPGDHVVRDDGQEGQRPHHGALGHPRRRRGPPAAQIRLEDVPEARGADDAVRRRPRTGGASKRAHLNTPSSVPTSVAFMHRFRVVLTGTPLQNNLGELTTLLSFLDSAKFKDAYLRSMQLPEADSVWPETLN